MAKIIIDGNLMITKVAAFQVIKDNMNLRSFYGNNLDALYDVLTSITETTEVKIINTKSLLESLQEYGASIIEVFKKASEENKYLTFEQ